MVHGKYTLIGYKTTKVTLLLISAICCLFSLSLIINFDRMNHKLDGIFATGTFGIDLKYMMPSRIHVKNVFIVLVVANTGNRHKYNRLPV